MDVTVVIATFGDESWKTLAAERAVPSALAEHKRVVVVHEDTLSAARNRGLEQVATEYVCFLDADDELEPGYFQEMTQGVADVRAAAVAYVRNERRHAPYVPKVAGHRHDCDAECLPQGNWLIVGSVARTDLVRAVGGWRDFQWSEDWDLWLRCHLAGATFEAIPQAVYRAHVRPDSRNRAPSQEERNYWHRAIAEANGLAA